MEKCILPPLPFGLTWVEIFFGDKQPSLLCQKHKLGRNKLHNIEIEAGAFMSL
jgi:hypothetical protein